MKQGEIDALVDSDLGFLKEISVHEIDGQLMMGDAKLPFNVAVIFTEKEFIAKWMMAFALGNDFGTNYFDSVTWHRITNQGTQAAMVVDDDNKPVLLVRPMISHNLSPRDFELLRITSQHIQQMQADTFKSKDPNASLPAARMLQDKLSAKRLTITDLVSPEFFERHGINPAVEKKVYYIKDHILRGEGKIEDINRSREILYKLEKGEQTTTEELKFIHDLSKGEYIIENMVSKVEADAAAERETPTNPMEC